MSFRTRRVLIISLKAIKLTVTQSNKLLQEGIEKKKILKKKSVREKMYTSNFFAKAYLAIQKQTSKNWYQGSHIVAL